MRQVDLRSDTVTLPSPAMREAMYRAELGDDVFGEDPTVNRLQEMAAERTGKEAALLVVSGTMGNLVSLLTHCGRGDEVILGDRAHIFLNEQGGMAALGGIQPHPVRNLPDGTLDLQEVAGAIRSDNVHYPRSRLICLENTHNTCFGNPLTKEQMGQVAAIARQHKLSTHLDGARIFNAAVALGVPVKELVSEMDSVQFCLSKGLSAPVGSLVCGTAAFIREAKRSRKVVGGGMRQAGIIAAAGIVALEQMVDRLADDHRNARRFAEGVAVAVSSCTAGLFLLGKVLGLGPDHKVAVPNLTFCATANAVLALGAQLYLLDTDENGLMSDLADFCGWYRAAIFVHFAGHHPRALTQERWIDYHILIHDQAHGFEPEAFAPNSVYSFFPNKNLTAGEGGLVVANRGVAEEIRERRNHGRRDTYTIRWPGSLNFRMTDLQAAILRVQLKRLPQMLAQKAAIERIYREFLDGWVKLPPDGVTHLFWIRHEKRDQIKSYLKMKGIETSIHYQPLSELGYCEMETPSSYKARSFPVSERIGRTTLSLPFYPDLTEEEAFMVCQAVREGISCKF